MDVRTGSYLWGSGEGSSKEESSELFSFAEGSEGDTHTDLLIIGAGISGALLAEAASAEGISCLVLDKQGAALGSTLASTAILQYEIDTSLKELQTILGVNDANYAYQRCYDTLPQFAKLFAGSVRSVGYQEGRSLYLASAESEIGEFKKECELRNQLGIEVEFLDTKQLEQFSGIKAPGALLSRKGAVLDPVAATDKLLRQAKRQGCRLMLGSVLQIEPTASQVEVRTDADQRIYARRVVVAMGYESSRWIPESLFSLHSTYAIASEKSDTGFTGWPERCEVWESARPYFYARITPDGRAICGGNDHRFRFPLLRDVLIPFESARLASRFRELFPNYDLKLEHAWAGTFAETEDGLPYLGEYPGKPNIFFACAYGGNGILFSMMARELMLDWLEYGRSDPIFGFERTLNNPSFRAKQNQQKKEVFNAR